MSTEELRRHFLMKDLFAPGELRLEQTGLDRLIAGGAMPEPCLELGAPEALRARFFHERRESGLINIGDAGIVVVDDVEFRVGSLECLYIGMGARAVSFRSVGNGQAVFYLLTCPAHRAYPTRRAGRQDAQVAAVGNGEGASARRIFRYIHEEGIESCQLAMGYTELDSGSVWNTWPPHTHARRSEVYLYFGLGEDALMHFLGKPGETRHLAVRDREAVLSPPWSIHCGVGTGPYRFVWGMAGENKTFEDMDGVGVGELR